MSNKDKIKPRGRTNGKQFLQTLQNSDGEIIQIGLRQTVSSQQTD